MSFDDNQDLKHLPPNLPHELNEMCKWANTFLKGGRTLYTVFFSNLFGHAKKAAVYRSDVYAIANMEEVSNGFNHFMLQHVFVTTCIYGVLKKNKMEDMIQFVGCNQVSAIGNETPTTRSRDLSEMYRKGKPGHIVFIPYNTGSLQMYKGLKKNAGKKQANPWKPLLGSPIQRDAKSYGYYLMHYMKVIIEDDNLDPDEKWGTREAQTYTTQHLMKSERNGLSIC
ncbi:hypothetical protein ACLB2K_068300 [Fragaria x ananassa]